MGYRTVEVTNQLGEAVASGEALVDSNPRPYDSGRSIDPMRASYPERGRHRAPLIGTPLSHAISGGARYGASRTTAYATPLGLTSRVRHSARNNVDYLTLYFACGSIGQYVLFRSISSSSRRISRPGSRTRSSTRSSSRASFSRSSAN